jgi:hypothetical protein
LPLGCRKSVGPQSSAPCSRSLSEHAAAITLAILLLRFVQHLLPMNIVKWGVVLFLFTLGLYRLFRASHPRGAGMRVGGRDLFAWSFLTASVHGAGLMVVPVLMRSPMCFMSEV